MNRKNEDASESGRLEIRITARDTGGTRRSKNVTRRQLQPPFREKDLLAVDAFIKHCASHGITIDKADLEHYEREELLLPAVRVLHGVVEYKKVLADFEGKGKQEWQECFKRDLPEIKRQYRVKQVDRATYYDWGALSMGQPGWLDWYKTRKMVLYPARHKFRPWKDYELPNVGYTTDWRMFEDAAETFYSRFQMYCLSFIQASLRLVVKNEGLFSSAEDWATIGEGVRRFFNRDKIREFTRRQTLEYHRFSGLLMRIEELWDGWQQDLMQDLRQYVEDNRRDIEQWNQEEIDELTQEFIKDFRFAKTPRDAHLSPKARALLAGHKFSRQDLERWRIVILGAGSFGLGSSPRHQYLKSVSEYALRRAEDPYRIVHLLNWFIKLCGGRSATIQELILGSSKYRYCPYCNQPYESKRGDRKTCGRPSCVQAHSNLLKREKRRSGEYKS